MAGISFEDFGKPVEVPTAPGEVAPATGMSFEAFGNNAFDQSIRQQTTPGALIWEGVKDIFNSPTRSGPPLAAPQQMGSTPGGAATYYGRTGRRTTPIMPLDERIRQAGGGDFTTLPGLGKTVTGAAANLVDMFPSIIKQVVGSGFLSPMTRTVAIKAATEGDVPLDPAERNKEVDDIARLKMEETFPAEYFAPWSAVAAQLGPEAELAYHSNPVAWIFGNMGKAAEQAANKLEQTGGLPAGIWTDMIDAAMGWLGGFGVKGSLRKSFAERGTRAEQKAAEQTAAAAEAEAAVPPPPPNYPGPEAVDITRPEQVREIFNRVKQEGTPAAREARAVDELFAKAARPLTPAEAIAASKARIAAIRAAKTGEEIGAQAGQVPKTRIAETPIVGEASTTLMDAQAKVARGERAMLTSEERIQLEGVERGERAAQAGPDVIDQKLIALLSGTALVGAGLLGADEAMAAGDGSEGGGLLPAAVLGAAGLAGKARKVAPRIANEAGVIRDAIAGIPGAFDKIYKNSAPRLEKVLTRFTRDPARAQDLVQETMLSVQQHLAEFKGDSALNTWIYRIGLNKAKNDAIAQGRRISEVDMSDALAETVEERVAGKTLTPEQELQNKQLGSRLQEAMDSISPEHRAAFEMRELQGMEYEAIAQELGVPIGTVRSRISRAKDALQSFLKGERGRADIGMTGALGAGAIGALAATGLSEDSGAAEAGAGYVAGLLASLPFQGKGGVGKSFYQGGAVKGPGGYFPKETIEKIAKPFVKGIDIRQDMADIPNLRERPKAEQIAIAEKMFADKAAAPYRMVTNWLNKYAGTVKDPLNDMMLPVTVRDPVTYEVTGSVLKRWEDLIDTVLVKKPPTSFAQPMPGGFNAYPSFKELPLNEVSWGFGEQSSYPKADPRVNFADYNAERAARVDYSTRKGEVDYRERSAAQSAIDDFLTHAGDYYETIPEAKRANYDLPRLLKEVAADDIKKAKEAASYKVEAAKARQESVAPDNPDVVKRFDPVELPERTLHRNEAGGESASRLVEETLPASKEQFSIVKLTKAGQFFDEGRFMGHSVGGYDLREGMPGWTTKSGTVKENRYASDSYGHGGWEAIQSGYAEVYSLRDAKGNSYATFEVRRPTALYAKDLIGERPQAELTQMKGPGNRVVSPEAQAYAQDFVTDLKWTEVNGNDLEKIGLTRSEWKARRDAKDAESGMMDYYPEEGHSTPFTYEAGSGWANPETNMIDLPPGRYSKEDLHKAHVRAGYVIDPRFLRAADVPILERAGTPVTEAMKEQARQYQGDEISGFSNRQRGAADPRFLAAVAAGTVSALALSNYFSDSPEEISGALGAGILGARGSKAARFARDGIAPVGKGLDYLLGSVSTRLGNLAPELKLRAREFERKSLERLGQAQAEIYPFLKALNKLPTAQKESLNAALLDGTPGVVAEAIKGDPVLVDGWRKVQNLLGEFRDEHVAAGRFKKGLTDYFPRVVKDLKGLMEALGETERSSLDVALAKASAKMLKEQQRPLTDVEESIVVRNSLLAEPATSQQAGYAKRRGIEMEDKLQQFYEKPTDSLLRYVSAAVHDLETSKFFGKDLKTTKAGTGEFTNVEGSIAEMVTRMRQEGKLTREGEIDLRNILKARFIGGEQSMTGWLQDVRNTSNAALLGSLHSAATQIGDSIATIRHHGFLPTLQAMKQKLTGDSQVSAKEFNLVNHVAEEMGTARWSGELQRQVFKLGFGAIDQFAKGLGLNASLLKNQRLARTTKGQTQLAEKYQQAYRDEFGQLVADLKAGRKTELTKSLIWSELSDAQPISKMEMPEAYLNHPNGRMLYQMKTYMLKQMDIIRRDGFQEIAKGNYVKGAKALVGLATYLTLANIPGDIIKDLLSGRPIELDNIDYVENLLKNFGINRYTMDKLSGNRPFKGGWEAAMGYVTPVAGGIISSFDDPAKLVKYVPAVGRGVYDRYLGGNEKAEAADKLRARVAARDRAEAASPQLKVERLERVRLKKERAANKEVQ